MKTTPSGLGAQAEAAVAEALVGAGKYVYVPLFSGHSRVDLILEDEQGLQRVQCKTSRLLNGAIVFRTCSNTANQPRHYRGEVDLFGIYSPERREVFVVPVDDVPTRRGYLRLAIARNGQNSGVRWAADYRLSAQRYDPEAGAEAISISQATFGSDQDSSSS